MTKTIKLITYKTTILFWCICICTSNLVAQSALSKGNWYKISISKTGVYKLDFNFLTKDLKIPAGDLLISKIGVFGYGGGVLNEANNAVFNADIPENNIEVIDINGNGTLEDGDYILFYADGPYRWQFNSIKSLFEHTSAYYSDAQHFFISTTEGTGKRVVNSASLSSPVSTLNTYDYYHVMDNDSINPQLSGRIWYAGLITNFTKQTEFNLPLEQCTAGEMVAVSFNYFTELNNTLLTITINNSTVKSVNLTPSFTTQLDSFRVLCPGENAKIKFSISSPISTNFYLDNITTNSKADMQYKGSQFNFRTKLGLGTTENYQFNLSGAANAKIWCVSNQISKPNINVSGNVKSFIFSNQVGKEFVVFEDNNAYKPVAIGKILNQNLTDLPAANNLIITHKTWLGVAKDLAKFHTEERNIVSHVVDVDEIYNEYSSGSKDVMAIRRFIIEQYNKSPSANKLSTVTLFGKSCVDYKGVNKTVNTCIDYVPTYETLFSNDFLESFCTDDFFGLLNPTDTNIYKNNKLLSVGIGRLPVSSLEEAKQILAKIKAYKSKESYGDWRNITTTVSDDYDNASDGSFYVQNENMNRFIKSTNIKTNQTKIYLDAFFQEQFSGGQRYEDAEKMLKDNFTFGSLLITYIGHGGASNWAQERVLSTSDLPIYKNLNSLPFLTTATCGFAPYDKPNSSNKSAGERFLLQKDGGAIGLLTTCREVLISDQASFMDNFIRSFYDRKTDGNFYTLGDIARETKNKNLLNSNSQKVVLLGDPALEINMPKYNVITTSVSNGASDTLKSLSKMKITGEVQDLSNSLMSNFNGFCQITVFDKINQNKLNYNDTKDPRLFKDTFETQISRIFKGSTEVINGKFSVEFIVPKDINYAIGKGKISYYAADVNQKPYRDAAGIDTTIIVGGANLDAGTDEDAPIVKLFMNDDKFVFGGITNADPFLLAKISDKSGINTTGAGVGHDITAILDGNTRLPVNLNNYYKTEQGDFTQGRINYPYYQLSEGKHSIKLKAWDVYNNPGEGYIEFFVTKSPHIALTHVLNYPNPFTTNTWFQFEHNRPNEPLDVTINIMTVSGKVVKRIAQKLSTDGFRVDKQIAWNGRDDFGDPIGRGLYIYVVTIRDSKGETAHQYEKLVLLQ
jgi:hypothetical protein